MRYYLADIETCPLPEDQLVKLMPDSLAHPVMPDSIKAPLIPEELCGEIADFIDPSEEELMKDCPAYKTKTHPDGDPEKRNVYRQKTLKSIREKHDTSVIRFRDKRSEWFETCETKRMAWEEKQIENKQKFIDDAALNAVTGSVKIVGIRDYAARKTYIFMAGVTSEEMGKLNGATYPCQVAFLTWIEERDMLSAIAHGINAGNVVPANDDIESAFRIITFYGNSFDWPFLFRRAWILGAMVAWILRKGRYFNDAITTDLLDVWQLGDRQEKVGGMDGLAKMLGTKRKSGSGEGFHRLWTQSPVAAVLYLLDDLDVLEEQAVRMGVIHAPKPVSSKGEK